MEIFRCTIKSVKYLIRGYAGVFLFFPFLFFPCPAVGVPIKLLHEGEGHGVTVEMKNGEIYRGHLNEAEDTMNCFMTGGEAAPSPITKGHLILIEG